MTLEQILFLSFIQGITEFIPVSSSAHLLLISTLCGWEDHGLIIDVAAHAGTLGSLLVYFRKDVTNLIYATLNLCAGKTTEATPLLFNLIIATLPVVIFGMVFDWLIGDFFRSVSVIAWASILFGFLLYVADRSGTLTRKMTDTTLKQALFFGLGQCLALINGVSRSGICMTVGRFMDYKRVDVAHFTFLMAIPTMTAACTFKGVQLFHSGNFALAQDAALVLVLSFAVGLVTISFMMKWLQRLSFTPFVIYRILLGILLLVSVAGS